MIKQHTEKWYKLKAACFGATDVASLLGHGYEAPDQIIQNKINYVDSRKKDLSFDFKHLVDRGTRYEPIVRNLFANRHGVEVKETGLKKLAGYPWQTASPDGTCRIDRINYLLEFKVKRTLSEGVPYKHWIQMQSQMAVWNIDWGIYCQNVIEEFPTQEHYLREIASFTGIAHGILDWEGSRYYWRLNEYQESKVCFDPGFWETTLHNVLIPAWKQVEVGRNTQSAQSDQPVSNTRKRKREDQSGEPTRKRTTSARNKGVGASAPVLKVEPHMINNWFRKDPLLDWLELYGDQSKKSLMANPYIDMIRVKNHEFASIAKTYIKNKYANRPGFVVDIDCMGPEQFIPGTSVDIEADKVKVSEAMVRLTADAIKRRVPIIMNACLSVRQGDLILEGVADMLVLNIYLDPLFDGEYSAGRDDRYCVVKFKFSTVDLRADGTYLLNNDKQKVYKAQLWILNQALGVQQGYICPQAYIVGRKYQYTKCNVKYRTDSAFGRLGVVDFEDVDASYNSSTKEAISWLQQVRSPEMASLNPMDPSMPEMFPNMKNGADFPWTDYKLEIAEHINDITLMYRCGKKVRDYAMEHGITNWTQLDADSIVYNGDRISSQILEFVTVNTQGQPSWMAQHGMLAGCNPSAPVEFYIDFESVGNMYDDFSKFPAPGDYSQIFLIGAVVVDNIKGEVKNYHYLVDGLSKTKEADMVRRMFSDFQAICQPYGQCYLPLIYWGNAEKYMLERVLGEEGLKAYRPILVDLCNIFRNCKIIFPGQFGYGLKQVAKVMHQAGHIQTIWRKGDGVADGISAMSEGLRHLRGGNSEMSKKFFRDVIEYNYIDCKVMQEMVAFFRRGVMDRGVMDPP